MKQAFTLLLLMISIMGPSSLLAQVTTASLSGLVTDQSGEPMPGATVFATHVPSGTRYGTTTRTDGRYTLPNVRVGGPYAIKVSITGYKAQELTLRELALGQKAVQDFTLEESAVQGSLIDVVGAANTQQNGAGASINSNMLRTLPTISRSSADFTRLVPMASEGGSFAGRNDQFNNYSLDGAIFNNPFGLDAATPGGQADAQPVSLDAIDQISVAIAPYDVTQAGFTGASINAVTKSGTNEFHGTVFGFGRNKRMYGVKVGDGEAERGDLRQLQTGFSIGGPIVKDKVFFFVNMEVERRSDLGSYWVPDSGTDGSNVSRVLESDMLLVRDALQQRYGYDAGALSGYKHRSDNQKGLIKFDINLAEGHSLSVMGNFLTAYKDKPAHPSAIGRRGPDNITLQFQNSGYRINNNLFGGIMELKSMFGNIASNKLQAGVTAFRDSRDPFSDPFPVLNINKDGVRYIVAGHEPFSINNRLDQDVFQINDNFNLYLSNHTLTLGGSFERFNFNNSFNLTGYGGRVFAPGIGIDTFSQWLASGAFDAEVDGAKAAFETNNANNTWALAETNLGQLAFYAQDEWTPFSKLSVTVGLRADMPLYFDTEEKIQENIDRNCCYDPTIQYFDAEGDPVLLNHTTLPEQRLLWSPRLGFNLALDDKRTMQLRGGTGLFTGRFPFVWVGNQVANPNFFFYCTTAPDFKFPQVWRTNLGYDHQLGDGLKATLDIVYTKDINAVMVRNYGLKSPESALSGGPDTRPIYGAGDRATVFGGATNAYVVTNTNLGYSLNFSPQITKTWSSGSFMLGYNFTDAQDAASIDAEISSDAYDRNPANVLNTNTAELAPSLYGNRHRFVGAFSKRLSYGEGFATTFSIFGEWTRGSRFSYTYAGDLNNDGSGLNDLIFIPTDAQLEQMQFTGDATAQRAAFKRYIEQDDYLSANRGQYAEKYGAQQPWFSRFDIRILQDLGFDTHNFQLSIDLLNAGNLLNSNWGIRQYASYTGLAQPLAVNVANNVPTYTFDANQTSTFFNDFGLQSRWQLQLGLRYSF
jgi:Carboxypeptidase regulatory-like domain